MNKIYDIHTHLETVDNYKINEYLTNLCIDGASRVALQSLAASPKYEMIENLVALRAKLEFKKMPIYAFGSLHETHTFKSIPYEEQVERLLSLGCDGIKFLQMKPDLRKVIGKGVDHESYDKAFSLLEERGVPVLMHCADPETFWDITKMTENQIKRGWYYGDGTYPSKEEHYAEVFRMLDKHPRLKVILAHFFFLSNEKEEAVRVMEKYPNVSFDLTPGWEMYLGFSKDIPFWREFFIKYQDRIIFGTDADNTRRSNGGIYEVELACLNKERAEFITPPYFRPFSKGQMRTLGLPEQITRKIISENFLRLVGKESKPLDLPLILKSAKSMLAAIEGMEEYEKEIKWLRKFIKKYGEK